MVIKGRHLIKGLPVSETVTDLDICEAVKDLADEIIECIKKVFEKTPPELAGDIKQNGIVLTGGGSMLGGLAELISSRVKVPCYVADNALECVALGTAAAFKMSEELLDGFEKISLYRYK